MANALTALRLVLVLPFVFFMANGDSRSAAAALIIWVVGLTTDLLDGPVARRRGTVRAIGRTFDHATDFLFVTSGIAAGAWRGALPWILPICITAAFVQYVIDSYWIQLRAGLRASMLGRYNGMFYFVPPCMDALIRLGVGFLRPLLRVLVWVLVVSTIVSMLQRLAYRRLSEDLASRSPQK
ncbi:MAG TPA: CDP-alcohol phosphatidyltransferase family protein [Candidatus Acidoferrales bacterium]|nr:CDP-alcohol phosphatidyltransferase family protein [Candidatus Acidoferrales bacterium]